MSEFETEEEVCDKWFSCLTEDMQDSRPPIMKFSNDDEVEHYEAAYKRCMEQFRWSDSDRSVLKRAFGFQLSAEKYEVLNWQRSAGQFGSGEWSLYLAHLNEFEDAQNFCRYYF